MGRTLRNRDMIDNLNLVIYTSTKGHFGYKNCYKVTSRRLDELFTFKDKTVHIKIDPESDKNHQHFKMKDWFDKQESWNILSTRGDWSHNDRSHAAEYYKDKLTCFSNLKVQSNKYTLFIEDDWIIHHGIGVNASELMEKAVSFLNTNQNKLCVRINNRDEIPCDYIYETSEIWSQGEKYTSFGPTFTFQPTIVRTLEWYHALRWINQMSDADPDLFAKYHCELISGDVMKKFSDDPLPFCFFNPEVVNAEHIGEEDRCRLFAEMLTYEKY